MRRPLVPSAGCGTQRTLTARAWMREMGAFAPRDLSVCSRDRGHGRGAAFHRASPRRGAKARMRDNARCGRTEYQNVGWGFEASFCLADANPNSRCLTMCRDQRRGTARPASFRTGRKQRRVQFSRQRGRAEDPGHGAFRHCAFGCSNRRDQSLRDRSGTQSHSRRGSIAAQNRSVRSEIARRTAFEYNPNSGRHSASGAQTHRSGRRDCRAMAFTPE